MPYLLTAATKIGSNIIYNPAGVAIGTTYCGAESPAITDTSFWNVRIRKTFVNYMLKPSRQ